MDFKKLRTFRCAAQTLNFSEAANELGYVQSAVTNQIKALEEELATPLFARNGRGVALTTAGEELLQYSQRLFGLREEAISAVTRATQVQPTIRIGGYESVLTYYLPEFLQAYANACPAAKFQICPVPVSSIKSEVLANKLDIAFVLERPFHRPGLHIHTYRDEEIVLVCSPEHPLAHQAKVSGLDLASQHLLLTEKGCCYRNQLERALIDLGAYPEHISEFVSIEAIKACVKRNMGIGALSHISVAKELASGELIALPWDGEPIQSQIHLLYSENVAHSSGIQNCIKFAKEFQF